MYKKIISLVVLGIFLVTLSGCTTSNVKTEKENSGSSTSQELRVGMLSINDSLPLVVAEKEGFFKKHGCNVKVFPFKSSIDESKAMEANELDIIMNDMIVQGLMKKSGVDSKVIAYAFGATAKEGRFAVVASSKSGITKPEDLYGKKVAISNNTLMDFLMDQFEGYFSLDAKKITTVNIPDLMLRMESVIEGKDIDAAILPDPLASVALKKGCTLVIDDTTLDQNFSQSVILASDKILKSHQSEIEKFIDAYNEAMESINKNPEKYREIAMKNAHIPDVMKNEYKVPTFTPGKVPTPEEVSRVTKWLHQKGLVDREYSYEEIVTRGFAK